MRVLILGAGAREHALAHTFFRQGHFVYCIPGNSGIQKIAKVIEGIDENDFEKVCEIASELSIDLTIAASEKFLAKGIADVFKAKKMCFFGPEKKAAQIESSKAFSKNFMKQANILTPKFVVSDNINDAKKEVVKIFKDGIGVVIKPDGLTAGKGVMVCDTLGEAILAIDLIMKDKCFSSAGDKIIIEERLNGREVSVMAFCDGKKATLMIPAQDHKRLYDGSKGPNTGGMGAYSPAPFVDDAMLKEIGENIFDKTMSGLVKKGIKYVGVLYAGLIIADGLAYVLEYNCRFGDPEAQAILPLLKSDLFSIMKKCTDEEFSEEIVWKEGSSCCVVIASKGYPRSYRVGFEIKGLNSLLEDTYIFHAGTKSSFADSCITSGGRVLAVCSTGKDLETARRNAYEQVEKIKFKGAHYRKDIASEALELCPSQ